MTTPNSDVIYAMNYLDLGKDGPMVIEAAPGLQGILLDFWQRPNPGAQREGKLVREPNVRYWHLTDLPERPRHVCFEG